MTAESDFDIALCISTNQHFAFTLEIVRENTSSKCEKTHEAWVQQHESEPNPTLMGSMARSWKWK
jgi:hypothetical protein